MPMSPRLLRPKASGHPDANAWRAAVTANGGSVSGSTFAAVDKFCRDIDAAGIRNRFYRLNLFCGNSDASLNAVRTPLYRGPSRTGTQYGNTTDTNNNFVAGDYAENSGLKGNGSTKYLETGLPMTFLGSAELHMFVSFNPEANDFFRCLIGARFNTTGAVSLENNYNGTDANRPRGNIFNPVGTQPTNHLNPITGRSQYLMQWPGSGAHQYFGRNVDLSNLSGNPVFSSTFTTPFFIFTGEHPTTGIGSLSAQRIDSYSIGAAFTTTQNRTDFHNIMGTFRTALGRT